QQPRYADHQQQRAGGITEDVEREQHGAEDIGGEVDHHGVKAEACGLSVEAGIGICVGQTEGKVTVKRVGNDVNQIRQRKECAAGDQTGDAFPDRGLLRVEHVVLDLENAPDDKDNGEQIGDADHDP